MADWASAGRIVAADLRWIWNHDLVCVGKVVALDTLERRLSPNCDQSPSETRIKRLDITIGGIEVLQGAIEDSIITVSRLANHDLSPNDLCPGARVLFWGDRLCEDGWRAWGRLAVVRSDGALSARDDLGEVAEGESRPRITDIVESAPLGGPSGMERDLVGAAALGLARVTTKTIAADRTITLGLDSLRWAWGSAVRMPKKMTFSTGPSCGTRTSVGDSVLVPTPVRFSAGELRLAGCLSALAIKQGFVPSIGVQLDELHRAIRQQGGELALQKVLEPN